MNSTSIGELEQQVMEIVWRRKTVSVKEVLDELKLHRKLAYTTVATILLRLSEKRLLVKKENNGMYIYSPKLSKESYSKNLAQSFLKKFIHSFGDVAVASFAESIDKLPKEKRKYLLDLLQKNDQTK